MYSFVSLTWKCPTADSSKLHRFPGPVTWAYCHYYLLLLPVKRTMFKDSLPTFLLLQLFFLLSLSLSWTMPRRFHARSPPRALNPSLAIPSSQCAIARFVHDDSFSTPLVSQLLVIKSHQCRAAKAEERKKEQTCHFCQKVSAVYRYLSANSIDPSLPTLVLAATVFPPTTSLASVRTRRFGARAGRATSKAHFRLIAACTGR